MEPSVQPTLQPTLQPSRSPTEQSLANQFAEAALADRLVYLLIGVGVLLIVLCCLISYCCMSYGLPSLCLIYKTNVAKVYVDAQGNEIENFERRANQKKKKTKRDKKEPVHELDDLSDSSEERPPQQRRDGRGQPSSQDASNEGKPRLSSAERRYTVHPGSLSQLEAMSPLSGLKTPQPVALEHAIKRKTESDSKPLPFTTLADAHPSDPASFAEDSAASVQFNLQMWIQGLITANDLLRQQLGIPIHVKSTRKVHNLMSVTHPLSVSEINLLVVYAQEMTDENAGLQRLLSNAVSPLEEERGRKRKMRPKSSPPKHSVVNPQMPFIDNSIEEDCSVQNIDLPDEESASPVIIAAAEDTAVNLDVSVPSTKTKPGILGRIRQGNDDFTNDLPKEALGYAAEAPRPQSPNPLDIAHQTSHKKDEANFVRIAKNNGKGEAMEEIVKHEKVEKRKQFAQNLYKQKR